MPRRSLAESLVAAPAEPCTWSASRTSKGAFPERWPRSTPGGAGHDPSLLRADTGRSRQPGPEMNIL